MTTLRRTKNLNKWMITYIGSRHSSMSESYANMELAADRLLELGIDNDSIDDALISLYSNDHDKALFNKDGFFTNSIKD